MTSPSTVKAHCNKCGGERQQDVLHKEPVRWQDGYGDDFSIEGGDDYEIIKCRGCESVSLRHRSWFSEDTDPDGDPIVKTTYYPPAISRPEPRWLGQLDLALPASDRSVHDLFGEIYVALQNDSPRLAVMGIRALLEHVMIAKVGDQHSFKQNLDAFESKGFISSLQRTVLEPVLEAGHATMHRAFKASQDEIAGLMDITENLIESIYINQLRASDIAGKVPGRRPKK